MAYNETIDRTFNKDIAFLMELQRLEQISNNFAIEASHDARLRTLRRWAGALSGVLKADEKEVIGKLVEKSKTIIYQGKPIHDVSALDSLHDYLNLMNTSHKLQLTTKASGADAAKMV